MEPIKLRVRDEKGKLIAYEQFSTEYGWTYQLVAEIVVMGTRAPVHRGVHMSNTFTYSREMFSGQADKNKCDIYENDYVKDETTVFKVEWDRNNTRFMLTPIEPLKKETEDHLWEILHDYNQLGDGYFTRQDLEVFPYEIIKAERERAEKKGTLHS